MNIDYFPLLILNPVLFEIKSCHPLLQVGNMTYFCKNWIHFFSNETLSHSHMYNAWPVGMCESIPHSIRLIRVYRISSKKNNSSISRKKTSPTTTFEKNTILGSTYCISSLQIGNDSSKNLYRKNYWPCVTDFKMIFEIYGET